MITVSNLYLYCCRIWLLAPESVVHIMSAPSTIASLAAHFEVLVFVLSPAPVPTFRILDVHSGPLDSGTRS